MPRPSKIPAVQPVNPPDSHKFCSMCGDKKPIEDFHLDHSNPDGRRNTCRDCRAEQHEEETKAAMDPRLEKLEQAGLEALDAFASGGSYNPHIQELIDGFMRFLGGHYGLVKLTMAHYHQSKPGSAERGKTLDKIFRLITMNDDKEGSLDKLSRDQVEQILLSVAGKMNMLPAPDSLPQSLDAAGAVNAASFVRSSP